MFNRYLATAVLCCSVGLAHAEEMSHGFKFTSTPGTLNLSTLNCENPYQVVYTLSNTGHLPVEIDNIFVRWDDEEDTLDDAAVQFTSMGDTDCSNFALLGPGGGSCNIAFNLVPCTAGTLDRQLVVNGTVARQIPLPKIAKAPLVGIVTQDEPDSE